MQTFPRPPTSLSPPALSASTVLIRRIGSTPLRSPNLNQVVIRDSAFRRVTIVNPTGFMSVVLAELLSSDETLTASCVLIKSKRALLLSKIPFSAIPSHQPTVGNPCCRAACLRIESTPCSIIARLHYKRHWCQAADYFPDLLQCTITVDLLQCSNGGITVPGS